jgi:hypothetical protein
VFRCCLPSSSSRYGNEKNGSAGNGRRAAHAWNFRWNGIRLLAVRQVKLRTTTTQIVA